MSRCEGRAQTELQGGERKERLGFRGSWPIVWENAAGQTDGITWLKVLARMFVPKVIAQGSHQERATLRLCASRGREAEQVWWVFLHREHQNLKKTLTEMAPPSPQKGTLQRMGGACGGSLPKAEKWEPRRTWG